MSKSYDINGVIDDIEKATGIPLSVRETDMEEGELYARLCDMRERLTAGDGREAFFRKLLLGELPENAYLEGAHRLHIRDDEEKTLFLLGFMHPYDEDILTVLGELLTTGVDTVVRTDDRHIAVIRQTKNLSDEDMERLAGELHGTLQTEALIDVRVAYDKPSNSLSALKRSYSHCFAALEIGSLYADGSNILSYHSLGLGKLIYSLSAEAASEYMKDHFLDFDFSALDNETQNTIKTFFENDLSIAETARDLYIHRNTLVYRLDKFQKQSGLDIRKFEDAITCRIGMMLYGAGVRVDHS